MNVPDFILIPLAALAVVGVATLGWLIKAVIDYNKRGGI